MLYVLRCKGGTLYCGITNNLTNRIEQHNRGKGARYTRGRGPVVLIKTWPAGHIRRYLIEDCNYLDAVIGLPANIFYGTGIPTCILVLKKPRANPDDILFIDNSGTLYPKGGSGFFLALLAIKSGNINQSARRQLRLAEDDTASPFRLPCRRLCNCYGRKRASATTDQLPGPRGGQRRQL